MVAQQHWSAAKKVSMPGFSNIISMRKIWFPTPKLLFRIFFFFFVVIYLVFYVLTFLLPQIGWGSHQIIPNPTRAHPWKEFWTFLGPTSMAPLHYKMGWTGEKAHFTIEVGLVSGFPRSIQFSPIHTQQRSESIVINRFYHSPKFSVPDDSLLSPSLGTNKMECAGKGSGTRCVGPPTRRCGRCGAVSYCSVTHQVP